MKSNKASSESAIIYTKHAYIEFDLTNKFSFKLSKLINEPYVFVKDKPYMVRLKEDNTKKLVWLFHAKDYVVRNTENVDFKLLGVIKNLDCKMVEISLSNYSINILV